jgi:hypothetical protein
VSDKVEQVWLIDLNLWNDLIEEFSLGMVVLHVFQIMGEFSLRSHHEGWKQDIPVVVDNLAAARDQVLQC